MGNIPTILLEEYKPQEASTEFIADRSGGSHVWGIAGIGHCGSKLAQEFYKLGYHKCLVLNTAKADLTPIDIPENQKFLMSIGQEGSAKNLTTGYEAVKKYEQDIYDLFSKNFGKVDRLLLCFGIGGGTGGGGINRLIDVANKYLQDLGFEDSDKRISILATLPDEGELKSKHITNNSYIGLRLISESSPGRVSSIIVIDNNKIKFLYPNVPIKEYWRIVNSSIVGLFNIFNFLSAQSSPYQNFDPSDYNEVMSQPGFSIMGITTLGSVESKEALAIYMRDHLSKSLWATGFDLSTAKSSAVIAVAGSGLIASLSQEVINYGMEAIARLTGGSVVHRGIFEDAKETLRLYTILSGLKAPELLAKLKNSCGKEGDPLFKVLKEGGF